MTLKRQRAIRVAVSSLFYREDHSAKDEIRRPYEDMENKSIALFEWGSQGGELTNLISHYDFFPRFWLYITRYLPP